MNSKPLVLLATGNVGLDNVIKRLFEGHFEFAEQTVDLRKHIYEFMAQVNPDILMIHDELFSSMESRLAKDKEWLQILQDIRLQYPTTRIVFWCDRDEKDVFLYELTNLAIWDIFNNNEIDQDLIISQLLERPKFGNAARFRRHHTFTPTPIIPPEDLNESNEQHEIPAATEKPSHPQGTIIPTLDDLGFMDLELPKPKERIVKIPEVISIPNKVVGVINLHPRAGSTFISTNTSGLLSYYGISSGVVEMDIDCPQLYEVLFGRVNAPKKEHYLSWHKQIETHGSIIDTTLWENGKSTWFPIGNDKVRNWSNEKTMQLLLNLKFLPILFCDIGSCRRSDVVNHILTFADEIWLVTEDSPVQVNTYANSIMERYISNYEDKTVVIGNKWSFISNEIRKSLDISVTIQDYGKAAKEAEYDGKLLCENRKVKEMMLKDFRPLLKRLLPERMLNHQRKGFFSLLSKKSGKEDTNG